MEENILRVISPLAAEFVPDGWSGEDEIQNLDGRGMMPYREQIEQSAAEQAVDLLAYYDGPEEVREHLVSIIPSVAVQDGKLCGCTAITYRQDLSEHQWNALFRDIAGQYSDGWGFLLFVLSFQQSVHSMIPLSLKRCQFALKRSNLRITGIYSGIIFVIRLINGSLCGISIA